MPTYNVHPFRLAVPDSVLDDLRQRLSRTRLPDEPPLEPWSTGTSVAYLSELLDYWRDGFDWRAQEAKLNAFRQFTRAPRGHRPALHPRARQGAQADAAAAVARLAGLGARVPQGAADADRSGALRRRPRGRVHGGGALAARLRVLVQAGPAPLQPGGDRRGLRRADDRRAGLRALRRAGRRLGRLRVLAAGLRVPATADRHPPEPARHPARAEDGRRSDPRGEGLPGPAQLLAEGGDRLPVDPGNQAHHARLTA